MPTTTTATTSTSTTLGPGDVFLVTDVIDAGGGKVTNGNVAVNTSIGTWQDVSTNGQVALTANQGYIGQLFEVTNINLFVSTNEVAEGRT